MFLIPLFTLGAILFAWGFVLQREFSDAQDARLKAGHGPLPSGDRAHNYLLIIGTTLMAYVIVEVIR